MFELCTCSCRQTHMMPDGLISRLTPTGTAFSLLLPTNSPSSTYYPRNRLALQVYCKKYKQVPIAQTYGLLCKARRLDSILNTGVEIPPSEAEVPLSSSSDPHCFRCNSESSPFFHPMAPTPNGTRTWLCNRCFVETRENLNHATANGIVSKYA